jgi:hypothetical protein
MKNINLKTESYKLIYIPQLVWALFYWIHYANEIPYLNKTECLDTKSTAS